MSMTPAIPGPYWIKSDRDIGLPWRWLNTGKLDAYPATIPLRGGKGNILLSRAWQDALHAIMTPAQWKRTWVQNEGWHNSGEVGRVQEIYFQHNLCWINMKNADGFYEVDCYYNTDAPPDLSKKDKYRQGVMTVDYRVYGVLPSDLQLPVVIIARDRSERLRLNPKYLEPLVNLPMDACVKSGGGNLNVRNEPSTGVVLTTLRDGSAITIYELRKVGNGVWGRVTPDSGWVAMWYTDWKY